MIHRGGCNEDKPHYRPLETRESETKNNSRVGTCCDNKNELEHKTEEKWKVRICCLSRKNRLIDK